MNCFISGMEWAEWSSWDQSNQTRTRRCVGGDGCQGESEQHRPLFTGMYCDYESSFTNNPIF